MVLAFYGPMPAPNMEVRHLNGKRSENNISNLAWGSKSQNALDRNAHGTAYRPNWSDPKNREKWTEAMRKAKVRAAIAKATGNTL